MKQVKTISVLVCAAMMMLCSCEKTLPRQTMAQKVFFMYSCGHNNLNGDLQRDILDLCETAPLQAYDSFNKLVVFNHSAKGIYSNAVDPVLMHLYRDNSGNIVRDTLKVYEGCTGSDYNTLSKALADVKTLFPAQEYGILFSSHGSGWLPFDYYAHGTKTIGSDYTSSEGATRVAAEIDVVDFAKAFRENDFRPAYMLLDACYMGGVETVYELKDLCRYVMASPCEITSGGFIYTSMLRHVFGSEKTVDAITKACEEYVSSYSSAAIALIDCQGLDELGVLCAELFGKYRAQMNAVDELQIQAFFRRNRFNSKSERKFFYDLRDIMEKSGASAEDLGRLDEALAKCVLYKKATERLFGDTVCTTFCGLSMYLPCVGTAFLNGYYSDFMWNKDTQLVI